MHKEAEKDLKRCSKWAGGFSARKRSDSEENKCRSVYDLLSPGIKGAGLARIVFSFAMIPTFSFGISGSKRITGEREVTDWRFGVITDRVEGTDLG
jgi:hypothetical protein